MSTAQRLLPSEAMRAENEREVSRPVKHPSGRMMLLLLVQLPSKLSPELIRVRPASVANVNQREDVPWLGRLVLELEARDVDGARPDQLGGTHLGLNSILLRYHNTSCICAYTIPSHCLYVVLRQCRVSLGDYEGSSWYRSLSILGRCRTAVIRRP